MQKKLLISTGLAVALATSPALALTFSEVDDNADQKITKDEFYGTITDIGNYSNYDADGDGLLDEDEFAEFGNDWDYDAWDVDDDGYLESGEFYDTYYTMYDEDENGHWDAGEWDDAGDGGLFDV